MTISNVLILAGGAGSRLKSVVIDKPKPLADILGRPFLAYQFDYLLSQGIKAVSLSVGYLANQIIDTFGNQYRELSLHYITEPHPLGTGGAIHYAMKMHNYAEKLLILNGDTYFPMNLAEFDLFHEKMTADISMGLVYKKSVERYGSVETNNGIVFAFNEKGARGSGWINAGIYLINPEYFSKILNFNKNIFSFETDILQKHRELNITIAGYSENRAFIDIGTPESYLYAQEFFSDIS